MNIYTVRFSEGDSEEIQDDPVYFLNVENAKTYLLFRNKQYENDEFPRHYSLVIHPIIDGFK